MNAASETAMVLAGGSAYGAFEVGVMKVLFAGKSPATGYQPLQADIFTGTSVGAFNAAVMLTHPDGRGIDSALQLEKIWVERIAEGPGSCGNGIFRVRGDPSPYLSVNCLLRQPDTIASAFAGDTLAVSSYVISRAASFFASSAPLESRLLESVNLGSFVDTQPFHALLKEVIDEAAIRQSTKRLSLSATNWVTGRVVHFRNADFYGDRGILSILASAAVPGFFSPVYIGADQFVDGGAAENTPLNPAIELGATELHVVDISPPAQFTPLSAEANTIETLLRVYYVLLATKVHEDIATVRWINAGIRALQQFRQTGRISTVDERYFVRAAGQILGQPDRIYRPIRVHHYFPTAALGGDLSLLDFAVEAIREMIRQGEHEALNHDCIRNGCVTW